jgi:hypothetical protein
MANSSWLDDVQKRLAKHALPPSYVQRFMEELADHLEDLKEQGMEGDAASRLGEPEQVADTAVAAYRRRSFLGRHPVLTFPLAFLLFAIVPVVASWFLFPWFIAVAFRVFSGNQAINLYDHHWAFSFVIVVSSTFLSILYGELALWFGVGRKWLLTSCVVLGAVAMFWEFTFGLAVMLPLQFVIPVAVGWWLAKRKCHHGYPATTFLVFAVSPFASYQLLWITAALTIPAVLARVLAWSSVFVPLLLGVVAMVVTALCYWKLAKRLGWGKRCLVVTCLTLATVPAFLFMPLLLMFVVPTAVASLLYCKLAGRSGVGRKWMFVSCAVLALYAATQCLDGHYFGYEANGQHHSCVGLMMCFTLAQVVVPLAIGWWFLRREHHQNRLQLAS